MNATKKGFTLVELLIVIGILAVLATTAVVILNPAQLLAQARDGQRLSDINSLVAATSLYLIDVGAMPFDLDRCTFTYGASACGASGTVSAVRTNTAAGWTGVNFAGISSGAPFGTLPIDPSQTAALHYSFMTSDDGTNFEYAAAMESTKYSNGESGDVESTDGGNNINCFEKGTDMELISATRC